MVYLFKYAYYISLLDKSRYQLHCLQYTIYCVLQDFYIQYIDFLVTEKYQNHGKIRKMLLKFVTKNAK